jgi:hypothetical protein
MAVVAKMVNGTIQFHPQTAADNSLAEYLADAVNRVKRQGVSKSVPAATLLLKQAEEWEARARDLAQGDVRSYLEGKARDAREQARKLSAL